MSRSIHSAIRSVALSRGTSLVLTIVGFPLLVRALGPTFFGYYATLLSLQAVAIIIVTSGMNSGVRKYISEDVSTERKSYVFSYYFRIAILGAVLVGAGFVAASYSETVLSVLTDEFGFYFKLLSVVLFFQVFSEYALQSLQGLKLEQKSEPLRVVQRILFLCIAITLAETRYGVAGVLAADIIANSSTGLIALYYISKELDLSTIIKPGPRQSDNPVLFQYGKSAMVVSILSTTIINVDIFVLSALTPGADVGYYKSALKIAEMIWFIPRVLQGVLVQSVSNFWKNNEIKRITNLTTKIVRYSFALTALCGIGLITLADDFLPLYYGPEFTAAVLPLVILIPGTISYAVARPIGSINMASGTVRPIIIATSFSAVLNLVLNLLLIPEYGTAGAAVATSIGYGSMVLAQVYASKQIGFSPLKNISVKSFIIAPISTLVIILTIDSLITNDILALLIIPPLGAIIFLFISTRTGLIDQADVRRTANYLRNSFKTTS